ncbi:uncharacterized protein LOC129951257 isoform X2 [Eupeodes corollae]|uniref:uncharacterized protein LOC129951257 isoform X2 n=1 Tax=Eupeodes corollae TaxID=290404 RepID=UPI0024925977|nr:uncharacterized protein LOC129951257 isoform X2 [Eupeodes corollae]
MNKSCAVVIFNFIDFDAHKDLERRTSSLRDVEQLEYLFFSFDMLVQTVNNPNLQHFRKEVEKLSNFNFTEFESILLIYMSHGEQKNMLCCSDGKFNFFEESKKIFRNPTLDRKPKFIAVQACKGSFDKDLLHTYDNREGVADDSQVTAVLMSSFEGFVSKLGPDGSMFIQEFTKVLRETYNKIPFVDIFRGFIDPFNKSQCESVATLQVRTNLSDHISNFTLN